MNLNDLCLYVIYFKLFVSFRKRFVQMFDAIVILNVVHNCYLINTSLGMDALA